MDKSAGALVSGHRASPITAAALEAEQQAVK
jgi:hypothetical protein